MASAHARLFLHFFLTSSEPGEAGRASPRRGLGAHLHSGQPLTALPVRWGCHPGAQVLLNPAAVGSWLSWTAHSVWLGASRGGAGVPESRGRRSGERWDTCSPREGPPRPFSEAAATETAAQATEPWRPEAGSASSWASLLCPCVSEPPPTTSPCPSALHRPGSTEGRGRGPGVRTPSVGRVRAHSPARDGSRHGAGLSASCGKAVCERGFQPRGGECSGHCHPCPRHSDF